MSPSTTTPSDPVAAASSSSPVASCSPALTRRLTDDELKQAQDTCSGDAIEFPVYVSPIAVIYNVEGVDDLQLSPDTLTQIFDGKITSWDDQAIAGRQPRRRPAEH